MCYFQLKHRCTQINNDSRQNAECKLSAGGSTKGGFASGEGSALGGKIAK